MDNLDTPAVALELHRRACLAGGVVPRNPMAREKPLETVLDQLLPRDESSAARAAVGAQDVRGGAMDLAEKLGFILFGRGLSPRGMQARFAKGRAAQRPAMNVYQWRDNSAQMGAR